MTFEPVQSLLAVGTNESKFGSGRIYVCTYLYHDSIYSGLTDLPYY